MRSRSMWNQLAVAALFVALAVLPACRGGGGEVETVPPAPAPATPAPEPEPAPREVTPAPTPPPVVEEPEEPTAAEINQSGVLQTVYFDYDKSELSDQTRNAIRENGDWIKQHDQWTIVIQGHADERGTIEYNLALGQRRADAVRDYLTSLGVAAPRLRTVSYGEERPAVPGHGETSWAKNRRAEFKVE